MSSSSNGIIDIPLIERITLDPEAAFANCLIENTTNGKALFVRKKDDAYGSKASGSDGSDSYRISNTVTVLGPPSLLKHKVIDLLLKPPSTSQQQQQQQQQTSTQPEMSSSYIIKNYATSWSSGIGVSYSSETHLAVLDVPTDGYPHKVALPTLFALSVSQAVLVVCSEVCTPSTLPDTTHCTLLHGIAKSKASLPEPHSSKFQNLFKERPTLGFVIPHFASPRSEALLEAWAKSAQCSFLFTQALTPFLRIPIVPEWQQRLGDFMPLVTQSSSASSISQQDASAMEAAFCKNVLSGMLHEQKTGMTAAKVWCSHIAEAGNALTPSNQNPLGLAVADALKTHISGALRASMVVCSRAVREARQSYASELPSVGGYSREAHEKHVEKALTKYRSVAAGMAIDDYASFLKKKLLNEWVSQKTY